MYDFLKYYLVWWADHWFIGTLGAWMIFMFLVWPFRLVNRAIRHANIRSAGWPPPHLDADGDVNKENDHE